MNRKTFLLAGAIAAFALFAGVAQAADTKDYPGTALEPNGNPIFTDAWTCDPAPLVVGDRLFVYTGEDIYKEQQSERRKLMPQYKLCPRCLLNYIPENEEYCEVCKEELRGVRFEEDEDDLYTKTCPRCGALIPDDQDYRSEEHTSELQSLY